MPTPLSTLRSALLGADPKQQLRASQAALVLGVYLVFAAVQHAEVLMGMIDAAQSWRLTAFNLVGGTLFYGLIRSGLNLRLAGRSDKALAIPQSAWALVSIAWSYGITGPARGGVILIMLVVLIYGIFSLRPGQVKALTTLGFVLLGSVMVWKAATAPARYDPRVEGMHLLFAAIVMGTISVLAMRMGRLRARLEQQRCELAQALQRIQSLATRDDLTGLTNRRAAMERMQQELAVRNRPEPVMSLALIDIDHFKRVNDTLGHAAGDRVLRRFADVGAQVVRVGDLLARWGGEEFLLVMPATTGAQAVAALLRLREKLQAESFEDLGTGLRVTFSAGVAECGGAEDLESAIARADLAMYRAKHAGRDRVLAAAGVAAAAPAKAAGPEATLA